MYSTVLSEFSIPKLIFSKPSATMLEALIPKLILPSPFKLKFLLTELSVSPKLSAAFFPKLTASFPIAVTTFLVTSHVFEATFPATFFVPSQALEATEEMLLPTDFLASLVVSHAFPKNFLVVLNTFLVPSTIF